MCVTVRRMWLLLRPSWLMCGLFGPGGSIDNGVYWACITSYDYDAPISEAGDYGQPGIGGPNKFEVRLLWAVHARPGLSQHLLSLSSSCGLCLGAAHPRRNNKAD